MHLIEAPGTTSFQPNETESGSIWLEAALSLSFYPEAFDDAHHAGIAARPLRRRMRARLVARAGPCRHEPRASRGVDGPGRQLEQHARPRMRGLYRAQGLLEPSAVEHVRPLLRLLQRRQGRDLRSRRRPARRPADRRLIA